MAQLKCPHCGTVFEADAFQYASIAKQVRDEEFKKELEEREALSASRHKDDMEKQQLDMERKLAEKDLELQRLQSDLKQKEAEAETAVAKALFSKETELSEARAEISGLKGKLALAASEADLEQASLKSSYEERLRMKDEQIAYYKDFKAKQSTKMVGESLEQYCLSEFNKVRMAAYPDAYFEKDNEVKEGSKGDFIFREWRGGTELLSIMFEMKNEGDTTATKHKNEDFFKELDKDRRLKGCEYAVLVSMLEPDNDFYNAGITEAYQYTKMYVVRPQCFLSMISLLRNMALSSLSVKRELAEVRGRQLDLSNFEKNMEEFKASVSRNYRIASDKFQTAVGEIDKTIERLQKVKASLLSSENNLRLIDKKSEDLSIRKLTKDAPSIRAILEAGETQA